MLYQERRCTRIFKNHKRSGPTTAFAIFFLLAVAVTSAVAQTFTVLHNFSGPDGNLPWAGLTADRAGNLYGTTAFGGNHGCQQGSGCGTAFKLSHYGSEWVLSTIYVFQGEADGGQPMARVLFGPDGSLYGTTEFFGNQSPDLGEGYGTVFKLTPPARPCESVSCPWTHTVLYRFTGGSDGANPGPGDLTFDQAGNIYGTTTEGGVASPSCFWGHAGCGVVFELTPSNDGWTEKVLYSFTGGNDGDTPNVGVVFDQHGNLYGTTDDEGKYLYGTVFQLTPNGPGWTESTIYAFEGLTDGAYPGGLTTDCAGNLYGITTSGDPSTNSGGTAFEMTPSGNGWTFNVLTQFTFPDGPWATPTLHNGNLYGPLFTGGAYGSGGVWEATPGSGGWTLETLYSFMAQNDGGNPTGTVFVDASGSVYGTTISAGLYSDGVVFMITP